MFASDLSLQFRIFGIPVQASLFFLILVVVIGHRSAQGSPVLLAIWVVVAFCSVLLHELGHALSARAFGRQPYISLYGLGGLTTWRQQGEMPGGQRFLVSFAGPMVGLVIGAIALVAYFLLPDRDSRAGIVVLYVVGANLGWGILNLIPMLPLDGGHIVASVFDMLAPGSGRRGARYVSILTAVVVAPFALAVGMFILALYCALAVWLNVSELRALRRPPPGPAQAVIDVSAEPPADTSGGTRRE